MHRFRKNLFLGLIVVFASITGYFLQEKEQRSYILEIDSKAGETLPAEAPSVSSDVTTNGNSASTSEKKSEKNVTEKKINLNTATKEELMALEGIGEVKAERIIAYRETKRKFEVIEDIMNVEGIGRKTFEKLKDSITVE